LCVGFVVRWLCCALALLCVGFVVRLGNVYGCVWGSFK